jgi:hypothetical protein
VIEDEIDGPLPDKVKAVPVIGEASAMLPDLDIEGFDDVDVQGALDLFDDFPWEEHRHEAATRRRLGVEGIQPNIRFVIPSYELQIEAMVKEGYYSVEIEMPSPKKLFGLFERTLIYRVNMVSPTCVRELIGVFFDPLVDRRRVEIEAVVNRLNPTP